MGAVKMRTISGSAKKRMMGPENKAVNLLVLEAGLEPAQGCPYRILSSLKYFRYSTYRALHLITPRFSSSMLSDCAPCALMVWAQNGHSIWAHLGHSTNILSVL